MAEQAGPDLLWSKSGVTVDERIQRFLAGEDVILDRQLLPYDIRASRAHAEGLERVGILTEDECVSLCAALDQLAAAVSSGEFVLDQRYEDGHSAIEAVLIEQLGDTGRKIHTGRSRNDQVLVATRLWLRDQLNTLFDLNRQLADIALARAEPEMLLPLPGYTHLQRAMVSSAGMWWAGWAESLIDNAALARSTGQWLDANPLGSASGFGVNLPLDRDFTTERLQFERLQISATYAQISRGKFELQALSSLAQSLLDVRRIAWDLSLFLSAEFGFCSLPGQYTTGSSLMPNKRNPDLIELLRASYSVVVGARNEIESLLSLPSGYHRDLQFSKGPLLRAFGHGLEALALLAGPMRDLSWNEGRMREAIDAGMYATDRAMDLAQAGVPFREAYKRAAEIDPHAVLPSPEQSLGVRQSLGAAGQPAQERLQQRLESLRCCT